MRNDDTGNNNAMRNDDIGNNGDVDNDDIGNNGGRDVMILSIMVAGGCR